MVKSIRLAAVTLTAGVFALLPVGAVGAQSVSADGPTAQVAPIPAPPVMAPQVKVWCC